MNVEFCQTPGAEWDAFVASQPGACLGHASAWKYVLETGYRLQTRFLVARNHRNEVRGVLPLARIRSFNGRFDWISLPFLDDGGILAVDAESERALLDKAMELAVETKARAIELRQTKRLLTLPVAPEVAPRVSLCLELADDEESQWNALPAKVRNQTRKARKSGLTLASPDEVKLADFYEPFCVNMRDLGSPVHGRRWFVALAEAFRENMRHVVVLDEQRPIGGLIAIRHGDAVSVPWASTLRSQRARCPNNLIYWEALRGAVALGVRRFDFGRSPYDSGTYRFKRGWGATEQALPWVRLAPDKTPLSLSSASDNPVLVRLSDLWRRLPVGVASRIGPLLRRRIAN